MASPDDILEGYIGPGTELGGRYEIEHQLECGAYGVIYLAYDHEAFDDVAVKALPPDGEAPSETAIGRFRREMKIVQNLDHPSVVDMFDYGETDEGILYMVMEYIDGQTLDDAVGDEELEVDEALSVTRQLAGALKAAHEAGVIHRDLKPANIMLISESAGYRVKVLDFGMAKLLSQIGGEAVQNITGEGVAVGTPRYIAPEQARGAQRIGPWTDLYAVGLLIYEMFTGQKAVDQDSIESAVVEHVGDEPLELPRLDEIPDEVAELIRRLVYKDLQDRPQDAADVIAEIDRLADVQLVDVDGDEAVVGPPRGLPNEREAAPPPELTPKRTESEEGGDIHAVEWKDSEGPLELDWDRYDEYADDSTEQSDGSRPKPSNDRVKRRRDRQPRAQWRLAGEAVIAYFCAAVAFVMVTVQLPSLSVFGRVLTGAAPVLAGFVGGTMVPKYRRTPSILRCTLSLSLLAIVLAHVAGPAELARGLSTRATWFLEPATGLPGVDALAMAIDRAAEWYVDILGTLSRQTGG